VNPQARFSAVVANTVVVPPVTQAGADHPTGLASTASTARQLHYPSADPATAPQEEAPRTVERPALRIAPPSPQPSLFQPGELPSASVELKIHSPQTGADEGLFPPGSAPSRRKPARRRAKADMLPFAQGTLDFLTPTAPPTRQLRTKVDASIICDQNGASPLHRFAGMMADVGFTLILAAGICAVSWAALHQLGIGMPTSNQVVLAGLASIWAIVVLSYQALFTSNNQETPGYRALRLRTLNLDGSLPSKAQRWKRMLASLASIAACGAGFLWAFFDEEQLAWHDHISGTFAAPESAITSNFRRK
jgi:uncharacterized RDD family membrane protein YckC